MTKAKKSVAIPTRKISETILDFGEPLFTWFTEPPPEDVFRNALKIVITVWNAHVMALPLWGAPEHVVRLSEILFGSSAPEGMRGVLEALYDRRRERFADDPRAIGEWDIIRDDTGGYRVRCDARLPRGVRPRARGTRRQTLRQK